MLYLEMCARKTNVIQKLVHFSSTQYNYGKCG